MLNCSAFLVSWGETQRHSTRLTPGRQERLYHWASSPTTFLFLPFLSLPFKVSGRRDDESPWVRAGLWVQGYAQLHRVWKEVELLKTMNHKKKRKKDQWNDPAGKMFDPQAWRPGFYLRTFIRGKEPPSDTVLWTHEHDKHTYNHNKWQQQKAQASPVLPATAFQLTVLSLRAASSCFHAHDQAR